MAKYKIQMKSKEVHLDRFLVPVLKTQYEGVHLLFLCLSWYELSFKCFISETSRAPTGHSMDVFPMPTSSKYLLCLVYL